MPWYVAKKKENVRQRLHISDTPQGQGYFTSICVTQEKTKLVNFVRKYPSVTKLA